MTLSYVDPRRTGRTDTGLPSIPRDRQTRTGHAASTDRSFCDQGDNRKEAPVAAKQTKPFHKPAGSLLSNMMEDGPTEDGPSGKQMIVGQMIVVSVGLGDRPLAAANLLESITMWPPRRTASKVQATDFPQ